jgi:hypothetical protein
MNGSKIPAMVREIRRINRRIRQTGRNPENLRFPKTPGTLLILNKPLKVKMSKDLKGLKKHQKHSRLARRI